MESEKTGLLIKKLRRDRGLTQRELANLVSVSDKAISKWERGMGCPDVSLLASLGSALGVSVDVLLAGDLPVSSSKGASMKKATWFVCPTCGGVSMCAGAPDARVVCCGQTLEPLELRKARPEQKLSAEETDGSWFISSSHPMTKEDYVSFVALVNGDRAQIVRTYPEWDLQMHFPYGHGMLLWYSDREGLLYQVI